MVAEVACLDSRHLCKTLKGVSKEPLRLWKEESPSRVLGTLSQARFFDVCCFINESRRIRQKQMIWCSENGERDTQRRENWKNLGKTPNPL